MKKIFLWVLVNSLIIVLTAVHHFELQAEDSVLHDAIEKDNSDVLEPDNNSAHDMPQVSPQQSSKKLPPVIIDNFDKGSTEGLFSERVTSLGAFQGTWAKRPSWSLITKTEEERLGNRGKALKMEWKFKGGWCGWYTLLDGLDASEYNSITFWVKGRDGGERFDIGLADSKMQEMEIDAKYAGTVSFFLEGGITREWQKVKVPLARLGADVDITSLGSLVFWCRYDSPGDNSVVYIDDLMFENDPDVEAMEEYNMPRAEFDPEHPRSMWVWKIDPVVNLRARQDLFDLCSRTAIRTCYVYFGDFDQDDDPEYTKKLEEFLQQAHANHLHIEILTGNPTWCLKENHHYAIEWMKSFLEYNKRRPPEQRIDGCSFDVEPYLAGEWNTRRDEVKAEYLDLLQKLRTLIDSYEGQHFELGGAIPFFYESEGDFEENMLKYLDYSGLMVYYDSPRKVIDKSYYHVNLAAKVNKKMYIGVETQDLITMNQGPRSNTFYEEGWEEMERAIKQIEDEFRSSPGYGGIAMHCYYSYKLLQRGRNTPVKMRAEPEELPRFISGYQEKGVEIDGELDDWILDNPIILANKDQVQYGRGAWVDRRDYSLKAYAMWDKFNLYFAFDVTDNALVQNKTQQDMWEGDHIEFWLDLDLMMDYNEAMNSNDDYQFGFSPGNFDSLPPEVFIFTPELDPNEYVKFTEIGAKKTDHGYIVEVRIDLQMFKNIKVKDVKRILPEDMTAFGTNRAIYDSDSNYDEINQYKVHQGMLIGFSIDGSDCDDVNAPQKLLISTASPKRIWGDPTTFNVLYLYSEKNLDE